VRSQQQRYRSFQSTQPRLDESKSPEATTDIPEFQNPLHHNDPSKTKVMLEDFPPGEAEANIVPLPPLDDGSGNVIAPPHLHELADEIVGMSMLEVKELVDRVSEHFGFEDGEDEEFIDGEGDGSGGGEEVKEEKTVFDLKLTGFYPKSKIKVIKVVRSLTGLGLKEAKEAVEGAPKTLFKDVTMDSAEESKAELEAVGATVEIE
jgi:large subunit ribosomal protein L7/L12